jgi:hypothetical protein
MCDRSGPVPDHVPHPYRDHRWHDAGQPPPTSGLHVDGNAAQHARPRLLGPDGKPAPRRVHGVGFRAEMIHEEA